MGKFQFYHINEHYISYLHSIDTRVQYNKGQRRPYVGIVLSINGIDYYVPLESPKPNHVNIKGGRSCYETRRWSSWPNGLQQYDSCYSILLDQI